MNQPKSAPVAGLLRMRPNGQLWLGNRPLAEGTGLDIWLEGAWRPGRVALPGAEWVIHLPARGTVPVLGAIARLPEG